MTLLSAEPTLRAREMIQDTFVMRIFRTSVSPSNEYPTVVAVTEDMNVATIAIFW